MKKYIDIGKKLFPLNRSITGKGLYQSLKILKKRNKIIKIKKFNSGRNVFDWIVPPEWSVRNAYVEDSYGKKIIDFKKNNLHLVSYSTNVNKKISFQKLKKKIHIHPPIVKAIPYKTSYYKKDWGFCLSKQQLDYFNKKYLSNSIFKVFIDSSFKKNGNMHYGEAYIKGKSKKEILISTYLCHPSMANNELSGPLLSLALIDYFSKKKNFYSLRFLFLSETIGSIAYINKNFSQLKKNVIGGYVLSCVGNEKNFSYIQTKYANSISDYAISQTFKDLKIKPKKYSFLERGSDERQYNGANIPIATFCKSKFGSFKEYHTSLDDFKLVTAKGLKESFVVMKNTIKIFSLKEKLLKKNFENKTKKKTFISTVICEPFLEKRGLFPKKGLLVLKNDKISINRKNFTRIILDFLQYADGNNDLKKISFYIKQPINKVKKIFTFLQKKKLIKVLDN